MKNVKLTIAVVGAVFLMGVLALNMYSSTSLPGFHGFGGCYLCHNDPVYVHEYSGELPGLNATDGLPDYQWGTHDNQAYSTNYIPMVPITPPFSTGNSEWVYNSTGHYVEIEAMPHFAAHHFGYNATHFRLYVEMSFDATVDVGVGADDKYAIMFNIDKVNFTVGEFMDTSQKMKFNTGKADMWLWEASVVGANASGMASDMFQTNTYDDTGDSQDVSVETTHGGIGHNAAVGWGLLFTRVRENSDVNDVQFKDGAFIPYVVAYWNGTSGKAHYSSFDKALVIGDSGEYPTVTETPAPVTTTVVTTTTVSGAASATTSAFSAILVIATVIAIPVMFKYRRK
jgi:hypothetical protein